MSKPMAFGIVLVVALSLFVREVAHAGCTAKYVVDLHPQGASTSTAPASVRAELAGLNGRSIELGALVADRLIGVRDFEATTLDGRPLKVELTTERVETGEITSTFSRRTIRLEGARKAIVHYRIAPALQKISEPCGELRRFGHVSSDGSSVLSAANLALVPTGAVSNLQFEFEQDPEHQLVTTFPAVVEHPTQEQLLEMVLVAAPLRLEHPLEERGLRLWFSSEMAPAGTKVVTDLVRELESTLGPPPPLDVVIARPADDFVRLRTTTSKGLVVVDMGDVEVSSLRELLRHLIPAWTGHSRRELDGASGPEAWFPLGLCEYLALTLPYRVGADPSDPRVTIEHTWARERKRANVRITSPASYGRRRVKSTALAAALEDELGGQNGWRALLEGWTGDGYPSPPPGPVLELWEGFLQAQVIPELAHFGYEEDWSLELGDERAIGNGAPTDRKLLVAFSSETRGHLENCGCKAKQSGGASRRAQVLEDLREEADALIALDLGNFCALEENSPRLEPLTEEETLVLVKAMNIMQYDAACASPRDLMVGQDVIESIRTEAQFPLLAHGAEFPDGSSFPSSVVLEREGLRIGVVGVSERMEFGWLTESQQRLMERIEFPDGMDEVLLTVSELRNEVDLVIVCGRMTPHAMRTLSELGTGVDLILNGDSGLGMLSNRSIGSRNQTVIAFDTAQNTGLNVVHLELDDQERIAGVLMEHINIPEGAPQSPAVLDLLDEFYLSLETREELQGGVDPLFEWDEHAQGTYVGAESCSSCHLDQYAQWLGTPHATAMQTLASAHRNFQAKCVSCHVLGLGREDGFQMRAPTPLLEGVQCEACHGAGGEHVSRPSADNIRLLPSKRVCTECHDSEHSDDFDFRFDAALESVWH